MQKMATVTVGCKLPHGLILEIGKQKYVLNGAHTAQVLGFNGERIGITHNVDKDFFDKWMETHKEYQPVKAGLIFAHEKEANVIAEGKEKKKVKTGFEAIDPDKPGGVIQKGDGN
ncbi:MAG: hypothetical protein KGI54_16090 [Pseudomonadota bacterium]|nr:hypothetical protein [Pseudomonadota bacterium]